MGLPKIMKELKKRIFATDSENTIIVSDENIDLSILNEENNTEEKE